MASNENVLCSAWPPSLSGLVAPLALSFAGTASFDRELGMATDLHHSQCWKLGMPMKAAKCLSLVPGSVEY